MNKNQALHSFTENKSVLATTMLMVFKGKMILKCQRTQEYTTVLWILYARQDKSRKKIHRTCFSEKLLFD